MVMSIELYTSKFIYNNSHYEKDQPLIIDGDHLTCLFALTLNHLILKLSNDLRTKFQNEIKIGTICTAYSNGAFMSYVAKTLGFKLIIAKTGVKHLHHEAKNFDLAIYFESNGHGTIFTKEDILTKITKLNSFCMSALDSQVLEMISIFISVFNKTTGDAISIFIATECSLRLLNMTSLELYNIYHELPAINTKVNVSDKSVFKPNNDETRLKSPESMQNIIDEVVSKFESGRCFIRPSGTEDVVRIYAEAKSYEEAAEITELVKKYILDNYS
jgi:phosphoacetylglucosamine mutase